jgi:hypothetical protein
MALSITKDEKAILQSIQSFSIFCIFIIIGIHAGLLYIFTKIKGDIISIHHYPRSS